MIFSPIDWYLPLFLLLIIGKIIKPGNYVRSFHFVLGNMVAGAGFNCYRIMCLYSAGYAIKEKERFNLAEKLRGEFDQTYHDGNALKLTFMVFSQKDGQGWMMTFEPFIKFQQ